ncbi:MAG TPA: hypothetical protein PKC89_03410 [Pyrinomonadaceae bacterium]|nr:hypothetical protein [Pyrinomonadaceae bacterium]
MKFFRSVTFLILLAALSACGTKVETTPEVNIAPQPAAEIKATPEPTPSVPNLQAELLDDRNKITNSPLGTFDFKNHTYELPRGWQNPDGTTEITLVNGKVAPVEAATKDDMDPETKAVIKAERRIGMSYVTTKYFDITGDGQDEALVVLKIETAGSAIPQLVYVFTWKDGKPELIWPFRTGDRADGGLKDLRAENGELVVELYGRDRFILGQTETGKITGDEEQLCCPTFFTRSRYKWNGKNFLMQGKRLTFSVEDPNAAPIENLGDIMNDPAKAKKYLESTPAPKR